MGNVPEERDFSNPISFEHSLNSTARPIVLTDCLQKLASLCFAVHLEAQIRTCFPRGGPVFKIIRTFCVSSLILVYRKLG